jgi:hypothetical protein
MGVWSINSHSSFSVCMVMVVVVVGWSGGGGVVLMVGLGGGTGVAMVGEVPGIVCHTSIMVMVGVFVKSSSS